jgi:hypothetical protein
MKYLEWFEPRNAAQCTFSNQDIPDFRIRYAHDMLMNEHNTEQGAKLLVSEFDPKVSNFLVIACTYIF